MATNDYGLTPELREKLRAATAIADDAQAPWPGGITDDDVVRMIAGKREVSAEIRAAILDRMRDWRDR